MLISIGMFMIVSSCNYPNQPFRIISRSKIPVAGKAPGVLLNAIKIEFPIVTATEVPVVPASEGADLGAAQPPEPVVPGTTAPDKGMDALNPLNGLPVQNPDTLLLPPALVTITNWPPSARPQAGLTFSPIVFEWYIGEGMSRYQAIFYGDYPQQSQPSNSSTNPASNAHSDEAALGPIRSGRLPFEKIRTLYNGFLIMASAYKGVAQHLSQFSNIFGSDDSNINSAMIKVTQLQDFAYNAHKKVGDVSLIGMVFDPNPPAGGQPASRLWFMYNVINELIWNYDEGAGVYNRYQYTEDNKNTFIEDTDRLNGNPLGYSNVVVLFAEHRACTETAFDVDLMYVNRAPALLFRDGQVYKIYWTTKNGEYEKTTGKVRPIRFIDEQGNPIPLKPGQTWIHVMPLGNRVWETAPNEDINAMLTDQKKVDSGLLYNWIKRQQPGSGVWATQYAASLMIQDDAVCQEIRNQQ